MTLGLKGGQCHKKCFIKLERSGAILDDEEILTQTCHETVENVILARKDLFENNGIVPSDFDVEGQ